MKILEVCLFSSGADGVFARVREESVRLANRGHEVRIFSSNFVKGKDNERAEKEDKIGKVRIMRFNSKKIGGESFMKWDFDSASRGALEYKPDIIIVHSYRHMHNAWALKIGKQIGAKVYLVTHAPFNRSDTRSLAEKLAVKSYDKFIGPKKLKEFNKVIAITKWEIPYLKKLGLNEMQIEYIPNGVPDVFFSLKRQVEPEKKILYLGRVARIKNLESVIKALSFVEDKQVRFEIAGPAEEGYLKELKDIIWDFKLYNRIRFLPGIFDSKEKIRKIDEAEVFVLPSKSEGMPQSLIEAMARGKIVLVSDNLGNRDLVSDGENGFVFKIGDSAECARKISQILRMSRYERRKIEWNARKSVEKFAWGKIIKKIEELVRN